MILKKRIILTLLSLLVIMMIGCSNATDTSNTTPKAVDVTNKTDLTLFYNYGGTTTYRFDFKLTNIKQSGQNITATATCTTSSYFYKNSTFDFIATFDGSNYTWKMIWPGEETAFYESTSGSYDEQFSTFYGNWKSNDTGYTAYSGDTYMLE